MRGRDAYKSSSRSGRGLILKIEILSNPDILGVVRGAVERLAEVIGFTASECTSIVRAVDEALANVIRHCYCDRLDQPISLYFLRVRRRSRGTLRNGLEILLCDQGPPVDRAKLCGRSLDDVRPGGLGLHFIRQAMDIVAYERKNHANRLRLVKYLPSSKNHSEA